MKLRLLRWGNDPGFPRGPPVLTKVLYEEGWQGQVREGDVTAEAEVKLGTAATSRGWKRQEMVFPEPPDAASPAHTWVSAQRDLSQRLALQSNAAIHLCCLKL